MKEKKGERRDAEFNLTEQPAKPYSKKFDFHSPPFFSLAFSELTLEQKVGDGESSLFYFFPLRKNNS